jgi:hypothetical protein
MHNACQISIKHGKNDKQLNLNSIPLGNLLVVHQTLIKTLEKNSIFITLNCFKNFTI